MVYVVEIWDKVGTFARKEYHVGSVVEATRMAWLDLAPYPRLSIRDVWPLTDERRMRRD